MTTSTQQDSPQLLRTSTSVLVMVAVGYLAYAFAPSPTPQEGQGYWYSILPPLIAIGLVVLTQRLIFSMVVGVVSGGLLIQGTATDGLVAVTTGGLKTTFAFMGSVLTDSWNLQVLAFIPFMLAMIAVMIVSGAFHALVERLAKFTVGPRLTQLKTVLAGLVVFFDDYANTMVVGSGMRPLTDRQKISRAKLAFLVDATSAPIAGIAIMSTWIGYEIGLFKEVATSLGLNKDGFTMFLDAIGFRFYCVMMLAFVFVNAISGRDFGPMLKAERHALTGADQTSQVNASDIQADPKARHSLWSLCLPLAVLFAVMLGGFWYDGGGQNMASSTAILSLSAWQEVLISVENSITVLLWAGVAGFVASAFLALAKAKISLSVIGKATIHGCKLSLVPISILILAWGLKAACDGLHTGPFLVALIGEGFPAWLFPSVLFVTAGLTAFATGTSWGTMAILIPTAIPVAFGLDQASYGLITMISLAAVLDGAILGDHCSPISDTTIMSSTASSCDHLTHVRTQLPYALFVGALAVLFGYLPAASQVSPWFSNIAALAVIIACHYVIGQKRIDPIRQRRFFSAFPWQKSKGPQKDDPATQSQN